MRCVLHAGLSILADPACLMSQEDPYFLYTMDVSETEFHALKHEQSILVDFAAFPSKFVELLEHCLSCSRDDLPT